MQRSTEACETLLSVYKHVNRLQHTIAFPTDVKGEITYGNVSRHRNRGLCESEMWSEGESEGVGCSGAATVPGHLWGK